MRAAARTVLAALLLAVAGVGPAISRDESAGQAAPGPRGVAEIGAGDPANGDVLFHRSCGDCHSTEADKNGVGPSLFGVVGRRPGSAPGFVYSPSMRAQGEAWDDDALDAYLADPRGEVAGTRMICPGVASAQDRADLVAYLATLR